MLQNYPITGLVGILCAVTSALGQTLRLTSASGKAGGSISIQVFLQSSSIDTQPLAIQWEARIPSDKLQLRSGPIEVAVQPTKHAGKSLACAFVAQTAKYQILRCLMAGGDKAIPSGAVARLAFRISEKASSGEAGIRFEHVVATTRDLKQVSLQDAISVVKIRGRSKA